MTPSTLHRPPFADVTLATGRAWRGGGGFLYEQKMDGVFHIREVSGCLVVGELMKDGKFYAFDCLSVEGQDIRRAPLIERRSVLDSLPLVRPATGCGGEFLETVLARGGEGVVAKRLDEPFGATWYKCKRCQTFDCTVTEIDDARGTLRLSLSGEDCGWLPAKAAFNSIFVGDCVEVACHSRHVSGRLREARFVRCRPDLASRR